MAESLVVSPMSCRIKAKNAYLRMKNCSPKFRSVLRQRYKERVQNSRTQLLNRFRHIDRENEIFDKTHDRDYGHSNSTVSKPFPLNDLFQNNEEHNLDDELLYEEIVQEELTQYENWLLQEYESMWDEEENDEVIITCPLCYSGHFQFSESHEIFCKKCGSSFKTQGSMLEIQNYIFSEVDKHKTQCSSDPAFANVPRDKTQNNLCIFCDTCSYLQVIL